MDRALVSLNGNFDDFAAHWQKFLHNSATRLFAVDFPLGKKSAM
jgi:hypothetical protein